MGMGIGGMPGEAAKCMSEIVPQVARLRSEAGSPLEEWKQKVEAAYTKGIEDLEELERFVSEGHEKSRKTFEKRRSVFQKYRASRLPHLPRELNLVDQTFVQPSFFQIVDVWVVTSLIIRIAWPTKWTIRTNHQAQLHI